MSIPNTKLKAFEEGTMNIGRKGMSKREQEELRRKQDQVEAAAVYEEFVASFQDSGKHPKTWVKGGVVNPDKSVSGKGNDSKIYKPKSKLAELASTFQSVKEAHREREDSPAMKKKKEEIKKKSNLEMFKEELKRIQEEREERHKLKKMIRSGADPGGGGSPVVQDRSLRFDPMDGNADPFVKMGGLELSSDETSTNIYIGNINPKMTENQLLELFGRYGPLASIKIMWPRTEEEISRGRNCGFVAFMNRKDGERALNSLKGKEICGFEMKLGWGKPVPIPPHPVYIPPALAELTMPPPPSGLPFNAQAQNKGRRNRDGRYNRIPPPGSLDSDGLDETLAKATVKVVIPTERNLLCVIHRMVEFVVREGPMFEAMIMNRELNNPVFKFLFENQSPAHIYYRWKLYSILNGDLPYKWRTEEFRMFKSGSWWKPPVMNPYTQGMPDDLVEEGDIPLYPAAKQQEPEKVEPPIKRGKLTDSQRDRLEDTLRELTPERPKIGEAMVWCMDHAESAEEVVDCIAESLSILQTPIPKKIARLFLVSDILFNSSAKVPNASFYRKHFQRKLKEIFRDVHETYDSIDGRLKAEQFKQKVMLCFRAWEDWAIYPNDYLINLQNIFLGLVPKTEREDEPSVRERERDGEIADNGLVLDGAPLEDPDLDGAPLVEPTFPAVSERSGDKMIMKVIKDEPDLDGIPLSEDLDGEPIAEREPEEETKPAERKPEQPKFVVSKWETIDEAELEAQAMTTSKWDLLEDNEEKDEEEDVDGQPLEEDVDGKEMSEEEGLIEEDGPPDNRHDRTPRSGEMSEERRQKLREIELKVMKYQDELEAGRRSRKPNMSLTEQIEHHRKKLLAKEFSDSPLHEQTESRKRHRSITPQYRYEDSPKRSKRSKSPKRRRSRSRSPRRRSSSRSPSRHRRKSKKKRKD